MQWTVERSKGFQLNGGAVNLINSLEEDSVRVACKNECQHDSFCWVVTLEVSQCTNEQ